MKRKPILNFFSFWWNVDCSGGQPCCSYLWSSISAGGPGSGKGSQCEILSYKKNFKHISGGELLRHEVSYRVGPNTTNMTIFSFSKFLIIWKVTLKKVEKICLKSQNVLELWAKVSKIDGLTSLASNPITRMTK